MSRGLAEMGRWRAPGQLSEPPHLGRRSLGDMAVSAVLTMRTYLRGNIQSRIPIKETFWLEHETGINNWHHRPVFEPRNMLGAEGVPQYKICVLKCAIR